MKKRKLSKKIIALIVCAVIIFTLGSAFLGLQLAFMQTNKDRPWLPSYEKLTTDEMNDILAKSDLSDEDYSVLYAQTGLTKIGVDRLLARGTEGKRRILDIHNDYFGEYTVKTDSFFPLICTDYLAEGYISHVYLENGDILVTSSTHLSGWRMGHAGLVTNGASNEVLQASGFGSESDIGSVYDFTDRITFMILRPNPQYISQDIARQIAEYAEENLTGKKYDVTSGVLTSKNHVKRTQCAHLVWYAYKQFGYDIDCNGGPVVTPKDIANSPLLEVVQVFGFDPVKLWK